MDSSAGVEDAGHAESEVGGDAENFVVPCWAWRRAPKVYRVSNWECPNKKFILRRQAAAASRKLQAAIGAPSFCRYIRHYFQELEEGE